MCVLLLFFGQRCGESVYVCVCMCCCCFLVSVLEKVKHTYMFAFFKAVKGSQVGFLIFDIKCNESQ